MKREIFILFLLALLIPLFHSAANDSIKVEIFKDCNEAQATFLKLKPEEKPPALEYAVRVLSLNTEAPNVVEAFVVQPNVTKTHEIGSQALWQSVDAKREFNAKKCALDLLESAAEDALPFITSIAAVYSQQNLGDELSVRIEEVTATIAEKAHAKGILPSTNEIDILLSYLGEQHSLVSRNIIAEYRDTALPRLLLFIARTQELEQAAALKLLEEIDKERVLRFHALISSAKTLEFEQLQRLLSFLELPNEKYLPLFVNEIAELAASPDPHIALPFAELLGKACIILHGLQVSPTIKAALVDRPYINLFSKGVISPESEECLSVALRGVKSPRSTDIVFSESELLVLLQSKEAEKKTKALSSLALMNTISSKLIKVLIDNLGFPEVKEKVFNILDKQATLSPNPLKTYRKNLTAESRFATLVRLARFNLATTAELNELGLFLGKPTCDLIKDAPTVIDRVINGKKVEKDIALSVQKRTAFCLPLIDRELALKWTDTLSLSFFQGEFITQTKVFESEFSQVFDRILLRFKSEPQAFWEPLVLKALQSNSREIKLSALMFLSRLKKDSGCSLLSTVRSITDSSADDEKLRVASLQIRARCNDDSYGWRNFIEDLINKCGKGEVNPLGLEVVGSLSSDITIPPVLSALSSDSQSTIIGGSRVGALLGQRGFSLVPRLWELRNSEIPAIRYAAVLALLEINPLTPDLHEQLRNLLATRFYFQALERPIEWANTAAVSELIRTKLGTLRKLKLENLED